ncbi:SpaA isopeptide-forming pilin-related protein [Candidatus Enterococcus ferrettii]|uniref:SpaA-like prealbumin fold domain-containing protein n=1 Tax=Candidatus Enterococcus ferrettii TaxID=2815324 RepID=A0ABV0EP87_9ENTE
MRKEIKAKKLVTILLPIIFLIGIAILQIPKGELLRASNKDELVKVTLEGKEAVFDQFKTDKETVKLTLEAKETLLLEIPYDENFSIDPLDEKMEGLSIEQIASAEFNKNKEERIKEYNEQSKGDKAACFRVINEDQTESLFLFLEKGQTHNVKITRNASQEINVDIVNAAKPEIRQTFLQFAELNSALHQEILEETSSSKEQAKEKKSSESVEQELEEKPKEPSSSEEKSKETKTAESIEETAVEKEEPKQAEAEEAKIVSEEKQEELSEEVNDETTEELAEEKQKEKKVEQVVTVPTKETKKTLKELESEKYKKSDSLRNPKLLPDKQVNSSKKGRAGGTVGIRDARVIVKTGTDDFDLDDNPGNDSADTNNLVRTFDEVIYLVSFSVQNESKEKNYKNIKYEVRSRLPNALKNIGGTLVNIGEIANGRNEQIAPGNPEEYSEGTMESTISNTGQVFVPVSLSVFAPKHGTEVQPEFELKIIEATNEETGEIETINKVYNSNDLANLNVAITKVSAKPSVSVKLVQGEVKNHSIFTDQAITTATEDAYDVAAVTVLKELDNRATGDYRGSTFPSGEITYKISQKGTYQIGSGSNVDIPSIALDPFYAEYYAPAVIPRTSETWKETVGGREVEISQFDSELSAPHGKTFRLYNQEPQATDKSRIGVFNSGDFTVTRNAEVKNENYAPTYNPYTYLMTGDRSQTATAKSFSSLEIVFSWDKKKTVDEATKNGWTRFDMELSVDSITYENKTYANKTSVKYPTLLSGPGGYYSNQTFVNEEVGGQYALTDYDPTAPEGIGLRNASTPGADGFLMNYGTAKISAGSRIWLSNYGHVSGSVFASKVSGSEHLTMWDSSVFKYDTSQKVLFNRDTTQNDSYKIKYGVVKAGKFGATPPVTMKVAQVHVDMVLYDWYDTPEEAETHGDISAIHYKGSYIHNPADHASLQKYTLTPVIVIGAPGARTPKGNPIVVLGSQKFINKEGNTYFESNVDGSAGKTGTGSTNGTKIGHYNPTEFTSNGEPKLPLPMEYWNHLGDTAFIKKMAITTRTDVEKTIYKSNENLNIKVTGVCSGSDGVSYDAALITTLPKGISYHVGSSKDGLDNSLSDPEVTVNAATGETTLKWIFSKISLKNGIEVNFTSNLDQSQLDFKATGYTERIPVQTVGEMWVTGVETSRDESPAAVRSSRDTFMVQKMQQVILSKEVSKPLIEVGDDSVAGEDTSVTYEINLQNDSFDDIVDGRLLDVLPYQGDSRGTIFNGTFKVIDLQISGAAATVSYSNTAINDATDPNTISGWAVYNPGISPSSAIENAKAILVSAPRIKVNEKVKIKITIKATGQRAGDVLVNNAQMNSQLNLPVTSQSVWTHVYGRDLTGYVWYDDDYDGKIGVKEDGSPEDPVENIPVKLYRTSQKDGTYDKELVKKSLSGEDFIDPVTGESKIKTGTNGKYKFENLPEGEYIAEFMVGDLVIKKIVIVTKKDQDPDETITSKADPNTYKTDEGRYKNPVLDDLPTALGSGKYVHHVTDVNAGLTRLSTIRLFKYVEGSAVDDGDGHLSDEEIEKTATPLQYAEFDLFEGNSTKPADKIGSATTDEYGWLEYTGLPPGDYTLVETKAPSGYELIKEPIKVNVPKYNYIVKVYVSDSGATLLPFTGGNKAMQIVLVVAGSLMLIGMLGIVHQFHPIKRRKRRVR